MFSPIHRPLVQANPRRDLRVTMMETPIVLACAGARDGFHALRHPYRTWLDEVGSGPMVQKELMRHSTISMTMDGYGRGVPEANRDANSRLVGQLLNEGSVAITA
jgi:integrase